MIAKGMTSLDDPFTLDQLRTLAIVAEEGSFSAAARKLRRVQSAVSQSMKLLEERVGVPLWDRREKVPALTDEGIAVLEAARRVGAEADALRHLLDGMSEGLEARVHLCVDALFPLSSLAELCTAFATEFPTVDLRVDTQTMSAVAARVLASEASFGIAIAPGLRPGLVSHRLAAIRMVPVVAPSHPLAALRGIVPRTRFAQAVQIVLTERERSAGVGVDDQAVLSTRTWRIADLHTKRALLLAGLGWGNLPHHVVEADLAARRLVRLRPEGWAENEHTLPLLAIHRPDAKLGPAHRWLLSALGPLCARALTPSHAGRKSVSSTRHRKKNVSS